MSTEEIKRLKTIVKFLDEAELKIEGRAVSTVAALLNWFKNEYVAGIEAKALKPKVDKQPIKKIGKK